MRKLVALVLVSVLFAACENSSQMVAPDALLKKATKCASDGYAFYGLNQWYQSWIDTTITPPDTVAGFDLGYITSIARECDAIYLTNNYGDLMILDVSNPRSPVLSGNLNDLDGARDFSNLSISGPFLYASWIKCTDDYYPICVVGSAKWNIAHPLNPRLISLKQDR